MRFGRSKKQEKMILGGMFFLFELLISIMLGTWWLRDFNFIYLIVFFLGNTAYFYENTIKFYPQHGAAKKSFAISISLYCLGVAGALYGLALYFLGR